MRGQSRVSFMRVFAPRCALSCLVVGLAWLPAAAFAQAGVAKVPAEWPGPPVSRRAALEQALTNNADLRLARAEAAPLSDRPAQEQSLMPPRVEAQVWQWPVTTIDPRDTDMYMFMLEQDFPGRGKRARRVEVARRAIAAADAAVEARRLQIAGAVRQAYARLALVRRDVRSAREVAGGLDGLVAAAQTTYAAGGGSQALVVRAMLAVSRVRERLASFEGDARAAAAQLNTLMGRAPDAPIGTLDEPPVGVALTTRAADDVEVERHPELLAARAVVARAESEIAAARQERRPDWMVQGGYMLMPGEAGAWSARVGVTWPSAPWTKGRVTAAVAEAEKRREARLRQAYEEAAARVAAAGGRLHTLRTAVLPQTRHLVDATRVAFESGQSPLADALEAQQMLLEAALDEARAVHELELARADLDTAAGADWLAPFLEN
jgi:cobalt-zinc-cadmium efflux system outer membrane protein